MLNAVSWMLAVLVVFALSSGTAWLILRVARAVTQYLFWWEHDREFQDDFLRCPTEQKLAVIRKMREYYGPSAARFMEELEQAA